MAARNLRIPDQRRSLSLEAIVQLLIRCPHRNVAGRDHGGHPSKLALAKTLFGGGSQWVVSPEPSKRSSSHPTPACQRKPRPDQTTINQLLDDGVNVVSRECDTRVLIHVVIAALLVAAVSGSAQTRNQVRAISASQNYDIFLTNN